MKPYPVLALALAGFLIAGCTPSMSPLYRDYSLDDERPAEVYERIRLALDAAGWTEQSSRLPNVVVTDPRPVNNWLLYRTIVSVEVAPLDDKHVRVFFHPYRKYVTGGRSKIPFLGRSVRSKIVRELNQAFAEHGLLPVGLSRERAQSLGRY